jgi:hypothetical protein
MFKDLEDVLTSTSASGNEALLPVQIDQNSNEYQDYLKTFYPGPNTRKKRLREINDPDKKRRSVALTDRAHYYELAEYLAQVSTYVNLCFAHLRYVALEGRYNSQPQPGLDFAKNFRNLQAVIPDDAITKAARRFIEIASQGRMHIIKPSTKFKGGFDIIYAGDPGLQVGGGSCVYAPVADDVDKIEEFVDSFAYERQKDVLNNAYSHAAQVKAQSILEKLLKNPSAGSPQAAHTRISHIVPLNFDFQAILAEWLSRGNNTIFGVESLADLSGFPKITPDLFAGLNQYFSILIQLEPNKAQVDAVYAKGDAILADPKKQVASTEYLLLHPHITFSIVAHLPEEVVSYITQTPKGKQVPLTSLNTWASIWSRALLRAPRAKRGSDGVRVKMVPKFIISAASSASLQEGRKKLGFYTEPGRTNEDDIFVANNGRFHYCPKAEDLSLDNAIEYEKLLEEALRISYDAGSPLNSNQVGMTNKAFALVSSEYKDNIVKLKSGLTKYAGAMLTYNWDYNVILTSSASDPEKQVAIPLAGATRPDELALTTYLKEPFAKSMALLFPSSLNETRKPALEDVYSGSMATGMLKTTAFQKFANFYAYLMSKELVPDLERLVLHAASELGIKTLKLGPVEETGEPAQYEQNLYERVLHRDLRVRESIKYVPKTPESKDKMFDDMAAGLFMLLEDALKDAYGSPRTNVAKIAARNGMDVVDDPHYFSSAHFTLAEFKNVYNYLGGRTFLLALQAVQKVPKKNLFLVDPNHSKQLLNYGSVVREVMPIVYILGKYIPDHEKIYEKAEAIEESNKKKLDISVDDIQVPGSLEKFQMFPHQVETHQYLRGPIPPRFAVLDIAPGGGKTTLLLSDIGCLIGKGLIKRPVVLAPNGLVGNWVEDMQKVAGGSWNLIPITTLTYRTWGDERLTKLISEAPINTIVVVGFSVTKLDQYPMVIGNYVEFISSTLEFLKKFGFDYVAIDESHKLKNAKSAIHRAAKQLTTSSTVKFIREATGTLISNKLTDVVGQSAIMSAQIFRTAEEYEAENSVQVEGSKALVWRQDTPARARAQLSKHSAVITLKRKEWAFMLPSPIETFIPVSLDKSEAEGGKAHQMMYDAVLKETLEEIKKDSKLKDLLSGKDDEASGDDDGDDDNDGDNAGDTSDLDDATLSELEAQLNPYLQRLEQLLTDPLGDPFGEIYFKGINRENFVSNKVLKIIERIKMNFREIPWEKNKAYSLREVVDFQGKRYVFMGEPGKKLTEKDYTEKHISNKEPPSDPRWKEESFGKVLVFCRYTRSVNAIYRALPPELKKLAATFHGETKNKWDNLSAFKQTPVSKTKGIQILIANEQAIAEGQNLQMANRFIRVESPWAPGDLDQSSARIFRPDPSKEFKREVIYLDWVLTNGSMEVSKMGRLISKMVSKAQFDEADNPLYKGLTEIQLPLIRMSLETIASIPSLSDISEYIDSYQMLATLQATEFNEMRQTKPSTMLPVERTPEMAGFKILENVPYVPNMKVFDRHNYGLIGLNKFLDNPDDEDAVDVVNNKELLIGRYVHTEFGNGVIYKVGLTGKSGRDPGKLRKITRVYVRLVNGDEYDCDPSVAFLATNLDESNVGEFSPKTPWVSGKDKRKAEKHAARVEREVQRQMRQLERKLEKSSKLAVKEANKKKKAVDDSVSNDIELYQVVYNGFLALEAVPHDDEADLLKGYGYVKFGDYAYITILNGKVFDAVISYLEKKFEFSKDTLKRFSQIETAFKTRGSRTFVPELAPLSEFKNFYTLRHKVSTLDKTSRKPIIKVYPVVMNGSLLLAVDLATNPAITRVLNKTITGSQEKFDTADAIYIKFFTSKGDLVRDVKTLRADGINVTNYADLVDEVRSLNYKKGMR